MPKQRFPEAEQGLFARVCICHNRWAQLRTDRSRVKAGKAKCRKCHGKHLRLIHKEHK